MVRLLDYLGEADYTDFKERQRKREEERQAEERQRAQAKAGQQTSWQQAWSQPSTQSTPDSAGYESAPYTPEAQAAQPNDWGYYSPPPDAPMPSYPQREPEPQPKPEMTPWQRAWQGVEQVGKTAQEWGPYVGMAGVAAPLAKPAFEWANENINPRLAEYYSGPELREETGLPEQIAKAAAGPALTAAARFGREVIEKGPGEALEASKQRWKDSPEPFPGVKGAYEMAVDPFNAIPIEKAPTMLVQGAKKVGPAVKAAREALPELATTARRLAADETGAVEIGSLLGRQGDRAPKEPWEMRYQELHAAIRPATRDELETARPILKQVFPEFVGAQPDAANDYAYGIWRMVNKGDEIHRVFTSDLSKRHRAIIEQALSEGKPVPQRVLSDYPDLAKQYAKPTSKRYYHGTGSAFDTPDPGKFDPNGLYGPGYYMTDNPEVAGSYAKDRGLTGLSDTYDWRGAVDKTKQEIASLEALMREHIQNAGARADSAYVERLQKDLSQRQHQLDRQEQMAARMNEVGPNTRAIDVPEGLRLLDVETPISASEALQFATTFASKIPQPEYGQALRGIVYQIPKRTRADGTVDMDWLIKELQARSQYIPGSETNAGGAAAANNALAAMGYDGIRYQGGKRIPMKDAAGQPIEHEAVVIFPESLPKIRNALSGTQGGMVGTGEALDIGSSATGAATGYLTADENATPEERLARAALGAAGGFGASRALRTGRMGFSVEDVSKGIVKGADDAIFIRATTKQEAKSATAKSRGYNTIPDREGYEKVYKPYGEQGAGYYYKKIDAAPEPVTPTGYPEVPTEAPGTGVLTATKVANFYELRGEQALKAAKLLGLEKSVSALRGEPNLALPYHSIDKYKNELADKGILLDIGDAPPVTPTPDIAPTPSRTSAAPTAMAREPWERTKQEHADWMQGLFADSPRVTDEQWGLSTHAVESTVAGLKKRLGAARNALFDAKSTSDISRVRADIAKLEASLKDAQGVLQDRQGQRAGNAERYNAAVDAFLAKNQELVDRGILNPATNVDHKDLRGLTVTQDHRAIVEQALREGNPVPDAVMADYPQLAAKYKTAPTPAAAIPEPPAQTPSSVPVEAGQAIETVAPTPAAPIRLGKAQLEEEVREQAVLAGATETRFFDGSPSESTYAGRGVVSVGIDENARPVKQFLMRNMERDAEDVIGREIHPSIEAAVHEATHAYFGQAPERGHQAIATLKQVAPSGNEFEHLIQIGTFYRLDPGALQAQAPELYEIAHKWMGGRSGEPWQSVTHLPAESKPAYTPDFPAPVKAPEPPVQAIETPPPAPPVTPAAITPPAPSPTAPRPSILLPRRPVTPTNATVPPPGTTPPAPPTPTAPPTPQTTNPPRGDNWLPEIKQTDELVSLAYQNDWQRRLVDKLDNPITRPLAQAIGEPAKDVFTKGLVIWETVKSDWRSGVVGASARIREMGPSDKLFKVDKDGYANIGGQRVAHGDVAEYPDRYALNPEQKEYVRRVHHLLDDMKERLTQNGVEVKEILMELGGHWVPRRAMGKLGANGEIELAQVGGAIGARPGALASFEKHRSFKTQQEALQAGYRYLSLEESVEAALQAAGRKIADRRLVDLVLPQIPHRTGAAPAALKVAKDHAVEKLRAVHNLKLVINRGYRGERVPSQTVAAIGRFFPNEAGILLQAGITRPENPLQRALLQQAEAAIPALRQQATREANVARNAFTKARERAMRPRLGEGIVQAPAFQGKFFSQEDAQKLRRIMDIDERPGAVKVIRGGAEAMSALNAVPRLLQATYDIGTPFIQGLPTLFYRPDAWAKAYRQQIGAFLSPRAQQAFYAENADLIKWMSERGATLTRSEMTSALERGTLTQRGIHAVPVVGRLTEAAGRGYETYLNALKIYGVKATKHLAHTPEDERALMKFWNDMSGTTDTTVQGINPTQRAAETAALYAPRYWRSAISLMTSIARKGIRGTEARHAVGQLIIGGLLGYTGISYLAGQEPKLEPTDKRFLTISLGGQDVGFGSAFVSLNRALAGMTLHPEKAHEIAGNYLATRAAPIPGTLLSIMRYPYYYDSFLDISENVIAKNLLPFSLQSMLLEPHESMEAALVGGAVEFMGGRTVRPGKEKENRFKYPGPATSRGNARQSAPAARFAYPGR